MISDRILELGFKPSPNPAADHIEKLTRRNFQEKPLKVKVKGPNLDILVGQIISPSEPLTETYVDEIADVVTRPTHPAVFIPPVNTFFTRNSGSNITDAHESGHSYVLFMNPELDGNNLADGEAKFLDQCVNEGLADFIALFVASYHHNRDIRVQSLREQAFLLGSNYTCPVTTNMQFIKAKFDLVLLGIANENTTSALYAESRIKSRLKHRINSATYHVGYFFVSQTVENLVTKGVGFIEAFEAIIKNPPTRFQELFEPESYAQRLKRIHHTYYLFSEI